MGQNNQIKSYVRIDAQGRDIAGTLVLRKKMPVTGRWKELQAYECCNPYVSISLTPIGTGFSGLIFQLLCGAGIVAQINTGLNTTTIQDVIIVLNAKASNFGKFGLSADGLSVVLELNLATAKSLCADTTTYTISISD